ncbi:MAG: hypothetical protein OK455_01445 [Thaumarchaeota archaeon]|nr:hypothetical protein [Nitrososphaerota archaeon]
MSFTLGFENGKRSVLAYSVLAIAVVAALSSVGIAFAATSTTTTTSTGTGSQTSSGSQSSATGSSVNCPNMGGPGGNSATTVTGMAG